MALKDKLGLAMIPSAYSGVADENNAGGALGTVHSVFPKSGDGDFDFSRGSDATRVNKDGLIESVQIVGDELVQNGGFDTTLGEELVQNGGFDTTLGSELVQNGDFEQLGSNEISVGEFNSQADVDEWFIATDGGVTPRATKSLEDGFMRITYTVANGSALYRGGNTVPAGYYKVTFMAKGTANSNFQSIGDNASITNNPEYVVSNPTLTTDWQNYEFYIEQTSTSFRFYLDSAQIGDTLDIDDIVVQEVGQNWQFQRNAFFNSGVVSYIDDGSNSNSYVLQQNTITAGNLYKLSFDVTRYNSGLLQVETGTDSSGAVPAINVDISQGVGSYHAYFKANNSFFLIKRNGSSPNFDLDIDNISVKEVQGLDDWNLEDGISYTGEGLRIETSGDYKFFSQPAPIVSGKIYKINYEILESNAGTFKFFSSFGLDQNMMPQTVGTHTVYGKAVLSNNLIVERGAGATDVVLDNISVQEVQGLDDWSNDDDSFSYTGEALKITSNGTSLNRFRQKPANMVNGVGMYAGLFRLTYDILENNNVTEFKVFDGSQYITIPSQVGSNEFILNHNGGNTSFWFNLPNVNTSDYIVIDNISVKEVTRDTDIPRLDYSDGSCPSLLLEPQRTNLIEYSEDFTQWTSEGGIEEALNSSISPDGLNNATKLELTATDGKSAYYISSLTGDHTFSVFAKKGSHNVLYLWVGRTSSNITRWIDLENGVESGSGSGDGELIIEDFGNDWFRISLTFDATDMTRVNLEIADSGQSTAQIGDNIYVYGAQLEQGSYPTSYIPTHGSAVTRLQDRCTRAGDSTIFNDEEGVLFAEIAALSNSGNDRVFAIHNSSNTQEYIHLRIDEVANRFQMVVRTGGANSTTRGLYVNNSLEFNKVAIRYKQGEPFKLFANGVMEVDTGSAGKPIPSGLNEMFFAGNFEGKVKSLLYFDRALTDEELEDLTTI